METKANLKELKEFYRQFTKEREWDKYHTPKDLSIALSIEASEIQELFLWKTNQEIENMLSDPIKKEKVREEIADVFAYLLRLSDKLDIDLVKAFYDKMEKNDKKYPIDKVKGNFKKYNQLDD